MNVMNSIAEKTYYKKKTKKNGGFVENLNY